MLLKRDMSLLQSNSFTMQAETAKSFQINQDILTSCNIGNFLKRDMKTISMSRRFLRNFVNNKLGWLSNLTRRQSIRQADENELIFSGGSARFGPHAVALFWDDGGPFARDQPGLATISIFCLFLFLWKILDLPGGQINDPSSGKHYSL